MYIKKIIIILCIVFISSIFCNAEEEEEVEFQWDHSIDRPYLDNYNVYYGTVSGDYVPAEGDRASHYSVDGGTTWTLIESAPPISVGVDITGIIIKGLTDTKPYFFAVTAVDTRGLESVYSNEVNNLVPAMNICLIDMTEDNFDGCLDRRVVDQPFTVCWDLCENALSYELKIAHYFYEGLETDVVTTTDICYIFDNLPKSSRHFEVKIRAIYSEMTGNWGSSSNNGSPKNWLIYSKPAMPGW